MCIQSVSSLVSQLLLLLIIGYAPIIVWSFDIQSFPQRLKPSGIQKKIHYVTSLSTNQSFKTTLRSVSSPSDIPSKPIPKENNTKDTTTHIQAHKDLDRKYKEYHDNKLDLRLALLDNYDSYTYNIFSYLSTICKEPPIVISNNAYSSWNELSQSIGKIDGIVISPGPGRPDRKQDIGICLEAIAENESMPILGICLGHQALGHYYNATVDLAPCGPIHGLTSQVTYTNDTIWKAYGGTGDNDTKLVVPRCNLFKEIPQHFDVVRYHSLVVKFPEKNKCHDMQIEPIAWSNGVNGDGGKVIPHDEDICMALQHKTNPHYGVQFHPESVGTGNHGYQILKNFCEFCVEWYTHKNDPRLDSANALLEEGDSRDPIVVDPHHEGKYQVYIEKISSNECDNGNLPSPLSVFEHMFLSMEDQFWLDSSNGRRDADLEEIKKLSAIGSNDKCPIISNSRFSIMGGNLGPLCKTIEYWGKDHKPELRGLFVTNASDGHKTKVEPDADVDIISYLHKELLENGQLNSVTYMNENIGLESKDPPFDYRGGYVGYLGYEVRHDTRNELCQHQQCGANFANTDFDKEPFSNPMVPTAAFVFADRSLVYDHWRGDWYMVGVKETNADSESIKEWMQDTQRTILSMNDRGHLENNKIRKRESSTDEVPFVLRRSKDQYAADIARCHAEIKNGESYELCLTNQLTAKVHVPRVGENCDTSPFGLYKFLRKRNPAPFSSFMSFGNPTWDNDVKVGNTASVSICCSSPERFLSVKSTRSNKDDMLDNDRTHGWEFTPPFVSKATTDRSVFVVESKPIKGTTRRVIFCDEDDNEMNRVKDQKVAEELRTSVKNRAENLMIVDLLRNDLSKICEPGSVHVPKLMGIESFATVHQMVSTIRGVVDSDRSPIDVIAATFPGGSMTGAPKLRSMDILNDLELGFSRGPYSGCLGYISLDGSIDLNIVIRTAVVTPDPDVIEPNNWLVKIGAGGAITALSESSDEFDEMLLKARAIQESVQEWYQSCRRDQETI